MNWLAFIMTGALAGSTCTNAVSCTFVFVKDAGPDTPFEPQAVMPEWFKHKLVIPVGSIAYAGLQNHGPVIELIRNSLAAEADPRSFVRMQLPAGG